MTITFETYASEVWKILIELSPWLLFGFLIAGVIDFVFPAHRIKKWLGHNTSSSVWVAALMGIPLPLCSCGVVPAALALRRRGASKGATISFLVTTPQSGVDSIMATWGLMGWPFAVLRTFFTLVTGILAGLSVTLFCNEQNPSTIKEETSVEDQQSSIIIRFLKPGWNILESIYTSLAVGILLAAIVSLIPLDYLISKEIASGFMGIVILAFVGLPLYVCATASIPLALAFHHQGGFSLGAIFVFLLVGPATNVATALIVKKEIGTRSFLTYLSSIFTVGVAAGYTINHIQLILPELVKSPVGHSHDNIIHTISAYFLSALLVFLFAKKFLFRFKSKATDNANLLEVKGMTCEHCRSSVVQAIETVPGISNVQVDLNKGIASFDGEKLDQVKEAILKAGFSTP